MADEAMTPRSDPFSPEEAEDPFVPEEEAFQAQPLNTEASTDLAGAAIPRSDEPQPADAAAVPSKPESSNDDGAASSDEDTSAAQADEGLPLAQVEELTPAAFGPSAGELHALSRVPMEVVVELGRTRMSVEELTGLQAGEVVALDRTAGQSLDIFVNGHPFASGEVVIVDDDQYAIRITEIRTPAAAQVGLL